MSSNNRMQILLITLINCLIKNKDPNDTNAELAEAGYTQQEIDLAIQMAEVSLK